jgi:predicted MPP superfamily phosphohydrolase
VALTHSPDVWARMAPRPALTLAGHTHGGQVAPFGYRRLRLPRHGRLYPYGWRSDGAARLYVTAGMGASPPPVRLQAPPEIVVIDLIPAPICHAAPEARGPAQGGPP